MVDRVCRATPGSYDVLVRRADLLLVCSPILALGDFLEVTYLLSAPLDPDRTDLAAPWLQSQLLSRTDDGSAHALPWTLSSEGAHDNYRSKTLHFAQRELTSDQIMLRTELLQNSITHETGWMILQTI